MAQLKGTGKSGVIKIGAVTVTASDVVSVDVSENIGVVDGDGMGDSWADKYKTLKDATITVNGYTDLNVAASIDTSSLLAALAAAESDSDGVITVEYYPTGTTTGNQKISGSFIMTSYTKNFPKTDMAALTATFVSKGTVTVGAA